MSRHLQRDMENLQRRLLSLCGKVEELVGKATRALRSRNAVHAAEVVEADRGVDLQEVEIEEECLKMLALHQPVAVDLRRIATALKVNSDLERMADLAVNIAERTSGLVDAPEFPIPHALDQMAELTRAMVRRSLDALVELDAAAARGVCASDDEVDDLNRQVIDELIELMQADPSATPAGLHCFSAARHLERIADHATNISEDVIYLVEGEISRHQAAAAGRRT